MPVSKAIGLMRENNFYEVFSWVGDRIGMAMVRDILRAKNPVSMRIKSFLNFVPRLSANAGLFEAAEIMADYRLRALPIVRNKNVIGKIDVRAIVKEVKKSSLGNIRASKIMTPSPVTMSAGEKVSKARAIMLRRKIDHLPIIKGKRIGGVITSTHIVFNLIAGFGGGKYMAGVPNIVSSLDYPVEAIMSPSPLECDPQTPISEIAEDMLTRDSSYSLVTVGEELHGIITYRDFAKLISVGKIKVDVPVRIVGLPDDPFEAEAAKIKFVRLINNISRFLPPIIEARSTIKSSSIEKDRRRYEVNVNIRTARKAYNYSSSGWDLPSIYDEITNSIKRMATSRRRIRKRRMWPSSF